MVGQLITSVLIASGVQLLVLALIEVVLGGLGRVLPAALAFALPFNFLLFALENCLFLVFPTRMTPATPADVQTMGRTMFYSSSNVVFDLIAGTIVCRSYGLRSPGERLPPALACAWILIGRRRCGARAGTGACFRKFDVAMDTPP